MFLRKLSNNRSKIGARGVFFCFVAQKIGFIFSMKSVSCLGDVATVALDLGEGIFKRDTI